MKKTFVLGILVLIIILAVFVKAEENCVKVDSVSLAQVLKQEYVNEERKTRDKIDTKYESTEKNIVAEVNTYGNSWLKAIETFINDAKRKIIIGFSVAFFGAILLIEGIFNWLRLKKEVKYLKTIDDRCKEIINVLRGMHHGNNKFLEVEKKAEDNNEVFEEIEEPEVDVPLPPAETQENSEDDKDLTNKFTKLTEQIRELNKQIDEEDKKLRG